MRPRTLDEFQGQAHLLAPGRPLQKALEAGRVHSMILWGPPGSGKTTLARLAASYVKARFFSLSAVLAGVADIRSVVNEAQRHRAATGDECVLFVDEVHRFNKIRQDAFLPHVEDGTLILIGATTENPSFELNNALLSRARVYVLKALESEVIERLIERALQDVERGLGVMRIRLESGLGAILARAADGDVRRALNLLEIAADILPDPENEGDERILTRQALLPVLEGGAVRRFDKGGDAFFDQISALHKSIRGSSPDGALYWLARMIDGGCDPAYIARRLVRIASEDIGNADPRALSLALDAWEVQERLGSPEGELALAQSAVYMAAVPKSDAVYRAFDEAMHDARQSGSLDVPMHLRNAPTRLMASLGHGAGYRHAHDEAEGYAAGERYLPDALSKRHYYQPSGRGLEERIRARLARLRALDEEHGEGRPPPRRGLDDSLRSPRAASEPSPIGDPAEVSTDSSPLQADDRHERELR
ncbi:replication-associated recombination protein A [Thioalkalivibrio sp. HK1]|uniref:replication-associated recombination protein A n=1 Tax=Thioalkalivibrio sp. HK1 TaxID=1469245 RepID=UPI0009E0696A|nr:replication-associated recombination protein A [Thioalkalivibrio sp. HK1]